MGRTISIRRSLLVSQSLLILLTSSAILAVTLLSASETAEELSRSLILRTEARTSAELDRFFAPIDGNLKVAHEWTQAGILDAREFERAGRDDATELGAINRLMIPLLRRYPQMSSFLIARSDGVELLLLRMSDLWKVRITRVSEWGPRIFWMLWSAPETLVSTEWKQKDYDPRKRPWFVGAISDEHADRQPHWTEPYVFFTTKDPGITASMRFDTPEPGVTYVVAFDVLLTDISQFTSRLEVSAHGKAVVLTEDGKVLGLPRDAQYTELAQLKSSVLSPADQLGVPSLAAAVDGWKTRERTTEPFSFESGGEQWWAGFRPFDLGNRRFWIGVMVPEDDFLTQVKRQRNFIVGITLIALILAIVMAVLLARRYARPLEALAAQSSRIGDLDLSQGPPIESNLLEVKQLARAQSQMLSALDSFARYVPIDVVRELLKQGEVAQIGGRTKTLTVVFTDICGFTTIAEGMEPEALTNHMAEYFQELLDILHAEKATVDKFVGDAIVAFWGAPTPNRSHARHAVEAVLACVDRLEELAEIWRGRDLPPLPTCFGIGTGEVVVGNIGARSRLSYTVLGDTVNLASRIEGLNRMYGTSALAAKTVVDATGDSYDWRLVDVVAVKGKTRGETIYEPLGRKGQVAEARLRFARGYEEAFGLYQARNFAAALERLSRLKSERPGDASVSRLVAVCEEYQATPPSLDWDGVARMTAK